MNTLHFYADRRSQRSHEIDLDSAFNDGYELAAQPLRHVILQWGAICWCASALLIGSGVMLGAVLRSATAGLIALESWFA